MEQKEMLKNFLGEEALEEKDFSPLMLAYLGDAVFEIAVRTHLCKSGNQRIKDFHKQSIQYVNAEMQSQIVHALFDELSEKEQEIVKKGRNTKSTVPKSASAVSYRYATGFEALLGYLYVTGQRDRLLWTLDRSIQIGENRLSKK